MAEQGYITQVEDGKPVSPQNLMSQEVEFGAPKSASELYREQEELRVSKYAFPATAAYIQKVQGGSFLDLKDDEDFQEDLKTYFKGNRYGLGDSEIEELGPENLTEKFIEHMRFQASNEATALMDLRYVKDTRNNTIEELTAFGMLMSAWDTSETAGDGFWNGAGDYAESIASSPSTLASLALIPFTFGTSAAASLSGLAAKISGTTGTQLSVRQAISQQLANGLTSSIIKKSVPIAVTKAATGGMALEGTIGYGMVESEEQTRLRTDDDYVPKTPQQKAAIVALNASVGTVLSGFGGWINVKSNNKALDTLFDQQALINQRRTVGATNAIASLTQKVKAPGQVAQLNAVLDRIVSMTDQLEIKLNPNTQVKDRLDPVRVAEGLKLRNEILTEQPNGPIISGLPMHTIQGIMAAAYDLTIKLDIGPNERVTTAIADGIQSGRIETKEFIDILDEYAITRGEFANIFMSELSDAGRTLGSAGRFSKLTNSAENVSAEALLGNITTLGRVGISTIDDIAARQALDEAAEFNLGKATLNYLKDLDAARIGFMTSQLATTARNTGFSTARLGVDFVDQIFKTALTGTARAFGSDIPYTPARNTFSMLRGMSWNKDMAITAKIMLEEDMPATYKKLFRDAALVEVETGSDSLIARATRFVNIGNTATDHIFKQAAFYASVDRQLAELADPRLGNNFQDFAKKGLSFLDLDNVLGAGKGTELLDRAVRDSLDFTFQKGYENSDTMFGQGASAVISLNRKIPFTVSTVMPFPRYVANHSEFIFDYMPLLGGSKGIAEGVGKALYKDGAYAFSKDKGQVERWSKQLTGAMMLTGAYYARASQGGETEFTDFKYHENGNVAKAGPILGAANAHMLVADLLYRYNNDLPIPSGKKIVRDSLEVIAGMGSLGFETSLVRSIRQSFDDGGISNVLKNKLAEMSSVFSYPMTLYRDTLGQLDPERSYTSYKPDMMLEDGNMLVDLQKYGEFQNRALKNMPDFKWTQHAQSLNDATTLFRYSIFNERPIGAINPLMKQITGIETRSQSDIQKELARLGLLEFDLYKSTQIKNPVIRYAAEFRLSKSLGKTFDIWRSKRQYNNNLSYDDLDAVEQRATLESFVRGQVTAVKDDTKARWDGYATAAPRSAAGYIRNMYQIEGKTAIRGKYRYDVAVKELSPDFDTADEYLASATSVTDQLRKRQRLMERADLIEKRTGQQATIPTVY